MHGLSLRDGLGDLDELPAGDALAIIYTYMLEDGRHLAEVVDRNNAWHLAGWTTKDGREPLPWVPNEITGGRPQVDLWLDLYPAPDAPDEEEGKPMLIDGVDAKRWEWAAMSTDDVGIPAASLQRPHDPAD